MDIFVNKKILSLLYSFEDDERILSFRTYDDIPLYLMGKDILTNYLLYKRIINATPHNNNRRKDINALKYIGRAIMHNMLSLKKLNESTILFYSPSRPIIIHKRFFNRYTDLLASIKKKESWTIEQAAMDWTWPFPRINNRVSFDGLSMVKSRLSANLFFLRDKKEVESFVDYYCSKTAKELNISLSERECEELSETISIRIGIMRNRAKWFKKTVPYSIKLMIMVGASYSFFYPITRVIKSKGIITADIQHGAITATTPYYSYSEKIRNNDDVKQGAADFFLTYGRWWNNEILTPSQKIEIGNPYREYSCSLIKKVTSPRRVLIIGSGINTLEMIKLTQRLSELLPSHEVMFRPHPGEETECKRIMKEDKIIVALDKEINIFFSLNKSLAVISEISTVLFDAIGICKHIIIYDTILSDLLLPKHPFRKSKSPEDICEIINKDNVLTLIESDFWEKEYKKRYNFFLGKIGVQ